jgi:hypothetical protein
MAVAPSVPVMLFFKKSLRELDDDFTFLLLIVSALKWTIWFNTAAGLRTTVHAPLYNLGLVAYQ